MYGINQIHYKGIKVGKEALWLHYSGSLITRLLQKLSVILVFSFNRIGFNRINLNT